MSSTPRVPEPSFEKPATQPSTGWPDPATLTPPLPQPTVGSDVARLIRRGPNGGTSYTRPAGSNVEWFRRMPNGGGTIYTVDVGEESVLDDGEK